MFSSKEIALTRMRGEKIYLPNQTSQREEGAQVRSSAFTAPNAHVQRPYWLEFPWLFQTPFLLDSVD